MPLIAIFIASCYKNITAISSKCGKLLKLLLQIIDEFLLIFCIFQNICKIIINKWINSQPNEFTNSSAQRLNVDRFKSLRYSLVSIEK